MDCTTNDIKPKKTKKKTSTSESYDIKSNNSTSNEITSNENKPKKTRMKTSTTNEITTNEISSNDTTSNENKPKKTRKKTSTTNDTISNDTISNKKETKKSNINCINTTNLKTFINREGYIVKKTNMNTSLVENIKKELTVTPHQTFKQPNIKPVKFTVYNENDMYISIPKFYGIEKFGNPEKDLMEPGISINIKFNSKLKPNQIEITNKTIEHINRTNGGLICVGCGVGKTVMGLYIACHYKVKTLIIVHKTFLLNQWKERIEQFTNAKVGIIQQNKIDVEDKDIVIGMLQSIARDKYDSDIFMDFGLVIFDEAHHAPSEYFSKALPIISCKLSLGLSATPKRADKMEKILFWYLGTIAYSAPPNKNDNVIVRAYNYETKDPKFKESRMYTGDVNRPKTINNITSIDSRNQFIIDRLQEILTDEPNRQVLILSDRIEHLDLLKELIDRNIRINDISVSCEYYIGGMKQIKLDQASEANIILGSYGMASEGLDIPSLNTLMMVTPRREVEQSIGRIIRRADPNIQPLIIDIVDMLPCFASQGIYRRKLYKNLNYQIDIYDVDNNIISKVEYIEVSSKYKKNIEEVVEFLD